jgi:capsular polysaccharide export protein
MSGANPAVPLSGTALPYLPGTEIPIDAALAPPPAEIGAAAQAVRATNLAFIDVGRRKLLFLLGLQPYLGPRVRCLFFTRRKLLRQMVAGARAPLFPEAAATPGVFAIDDASLRAALGVKLLALHGEESLPKARALLFELDRFFSDQDVGAVFVWNGANKLASSLAVHLAQQRGLPVIYGEHGYFPGTLQIDPAGVNQLSSAAAQVAAGAAFLEPQPQLDETLARRIECHRAGRRPPDFEPRPPSQVMAGTVSRLYLWFKRHLEHRFKQRPLKLDPASFPKRLDRLPQRFVFLPFQVRKDSQLLMHSPLFGNDMRLLLRTLRDALAMLEPGTRVVVKLHPREQRAVQAAYRDLPRQFPDVLFTLAHPMPELLAQAAAVVTVNSTVGFEAMLYDKPVVAVGRNFYVAEGLVERVESHDQFPQALARALLGVPDLERRRGFLRWVLARFLVDGCYDDYSPRSFRAASDRILTLLPR